MAGSSVSLSNYTARMCTFAGSISTDPPRPQMHEVHVGNLEIICKVADRFWCTHPWWYGCNWSLLKVWLLPQLSLSENILPGVDLSWISLSKKGRVWAHNLGQMACFIYRFSVGCPDGLQGLHRGPSCLVSDEVLALMRRVFPHWSGSLHNSFTSGLSSGPVWSAVYFTPSPVQGKQLMSQHHLLLLQFLPRGVHWSKHCMADHFSAPTLEYTTSSFLQAFVSAVSQFSLASPFIKKSFLEVVLLARFLPPLPLHNPAQGTRELLPTCWPPQKPPPCCSTSDSLGSHHSPFPWGFPPHWSPAYTGLVPPLRSASSIQACTCCRHDQGGKTHWHCLSLGLNLGFCPRSVPSPPGRQRETSGERWPSWQRHCSKGEGGINIQDNICRRWITSGWSKRLSKVEWPLQPKFAGNLLLMQANNET